METLKEFMIFVESEMPTKLHAVISDEDVRYVADNLFRLKKHFAGENQMFGSFMNCIANRDFYHALGHADSINQVMLKVYASYIYNFAPAQL